MRLENLSLNNNYKVDSNILLTDELNQYETIDGNIIIKGNLPIANFYVIIQWAKFAGKLNKRDVKSWNETLNKKESEMKIEIFNVCCDPLESWWSEK